jgi:hypothetical protein
MINTKPLKEQATKFPDPFRTVIQMQKDEMPEQEFIDFFISLRKKAREIDVSREAEK